MVHWFHVVSWIWFLTDLEGLLWEQGRSLWAGEIHALTGVTSLQCILLTVFKPLIVPSLDLMRVLLFHLNRCLGRGTSLSSRELQMAMASVRHVKSSFQSEVKMDKAGHFLLTTFTLVNYTPLQHPLTLGTKKLSNDIVPCFVYWKIPYNMDNSFPTPVSNQKAVCWSQLLNFDCLRIFSI